MSKDNVTMLARRRGATSFEACVRPHLEHLYRIAYRFTGTRDRAEDLVQDLLVRVYPRHDKLVQLDQPRPWLVRVMYRLFIDQCRRDARAPVRPIAEHVMADEDSDGDPYAAIADPAPIPEREFELNLEREQLLRALGELDPRQRVLLTLFEIEGYTLTELEEMFELPRGTIKSRLHRARARLLALLKTEPFDEPARVNKGRL